MAIPLNREDDHDRILETIRQMRMAAIYPTRTDLEAWIITSKDLLERLPPGSMWDMAIGYIDGMISLYNRRFGDEAPMIPSYRPPFSDVRYPGLD